MIGGYQKIDINDKLQRDSSPMLHPSFQLQSAYEWDSRIETNAVGARVIGKDAISTEQLGTGVITTAQIEDGAVTNDKISDVSLSKVTGGTLVTPFIEGGTAKNLIMGTPTISGGTLNNATIGTPAITNGTMNNAVFGTPSLSGGTYNALTISGTPIFPVNAGSAVLGVSGALSIQTFAGSASIAVRSGTITYYFTCAGTL